MYVQTYSSVTPIYQLHLHATLPFGDHAIPGRLVSIAAGSSAFVCKREIHFSHFTFHLHRSSETCKTME